MPHATHTPPHADAITRRPQAVTANRIKLAAARDRQAAVQRMRLLKTIARMHTTTIAELERQLAHHHHLMHTNTTTTTTTTTP